jgi:hypothetical protein
MGGYRWNGETWFQPRQLMDWASEKYVRREVDSLTAITAKTYSKAAARRSWVRFRKIMQINQPKPPKAQ